MKFIANVLFALFCVVHAGVFASGISSTSNYNPSNVTITGGTASVSSLTGGTVSVDSLGYKIGTGSNILQLTSITTPVTVNAINGLITTVVNTYALNTPVTFTVNNSNLLPDDHIIITRDSFNGQLFIIFVSSKSTGSFNVTIYPLTAGTFTNRFSFAIIKGQSN